MYKFPIIVFEGIEGTGKSFHIKNIQKYFIKKKIKFVKFREPGGSKNSEKIRNFILNNKSNYKGLTDLFMYMAARNENYHNIIKKYYKKRVILIDRFTDSTFAYQHYGMNINKKIIKIINNYILKNIKVDFTFLHIVNKKNLKQRLKKRKSLNRYDNFKYNFYTKVQKGFIKISNLNKKKYLIVNSNYKIIENKIKILNKINKLLNI